MCVFVVTLSVLECMSMCVLDFACPCPFTYIGCNMHICRCGRILNKSCGMKKTHSVTTALSTLPRPSPVLLSSAIFRFLYRLTIQALLSLSRKRDLHPHTHFEPLPFSTFRSLFSTFLSLAPAADALSKSGYKISTSPTHPELVTSHLQHDIVQSNLI